MQHVRETVPDVRKLRPEVSVALAAVIDRATAKDLSERFSDDAEMIAELERALALETNRAGGADAQVTAVIDTLPPETRRTVPLSVRRPRAAYAISLVALLVIIGGVVALVLNKQNGPRRGKHTGGKTGALVIVPLCSSLSCTNAYNPYAKDGISQNNAAAKYAVDGSSTTAWTTDHYYSGNLDDKPGVGIYVSGNGPVAARRLDVYTITAGFNAVIYATNTAPDPTQFITRDWQRVGGKDDVATNQRFSLSSGGKSYRYYLFWITTLPPKQNYISVNEIKLYR
jgi:serine/threonine-protein kinase